MYYIIGLGNPGAQYTDTPHNIGFHILEELHRQHELDFDNFESDKKQHVAHGSLAGEPCLLIKPQTYMNKSGEIFAQYDNVEADQVVVIYDDIDLPFGTVKLAKNRGTGGHNGLRSIEQHLKTRSFVRVRVGVAPLDWFGKMRKPQGKGAVERYLVHKKLSRRYTKEYETLAQRTSQLITSLIRDGYERAVSAQSSL